VCLLVDSCRLSGPPSGEHTHTCTRDRGKQWRSASRGPLGAMSLNVINVNLFVSFCGKWVDWVPASRLMLSEWDRPMVSINTHVPETAASSCAPRHEVPWGPCP
jgi:hypothetical protein